MCHSRATYDSAPNADSESICETNKIFTGHCVQVCLGYMFLMASLPLPVPQAEEYGFRQDPNNTHLHHYFLPEVYSLDRKEHRTSSPQKVQWGRNPLRSCWCLGKSVQFSQFGILFIFTSHFLFKRPHLHENKMFVSSKSHSYAQSFRLRLF